MQASRDDWSEFITIYQIFHKFLHYRATEGSWIQSGAASSLRQLLPSNGNRR